MELSLSDVVRATGARLPEHTLDGALAARISGWSIDSRAISPGDLFFAIKGERFDGHRFLPDVFRAGAAAAVVSRDVSSPHPNLLYVDDTVRALGEVAHFARQTWNRPVIAITGSAGKTSTKDIVAELLAPRYRVGKTIGNFNNQIGLPLTLLRLPGDSEVAVIEMGMNHAGEIRELAQIARPQIGLVTNVGYAHVEAFASIDGVAAAKRELIEALPADGAAVLNRDDERVSRFGDRFDGRVLTYGCSDGADFRAEIIEMTPAGSKFVVSGVRFETKLTGKHAISNVLAGLAVASLFDLSPKDLVATVAELAPGRMRGGRKEIAGVTVIDDSYNSNPEAARSMVDVLRSEPAKRRIAVLGEMLELGAWSERLHRELGRYVADSQIDVLVGVAGAARLMVEEAEKAHLDAASTFFFEDAASAGEFLKQFVRAGDAVLFKGSRGTHVEQALARMEE